MFNKISIPFNYEIHTLYSAFNQHNGNSYDQLLNTLELSLDKDNSKSDRNEIVNEIDDLYIKSLIQKFRKRIVSVPPLYVQHSCLIFENLPKADDNIEMDYTDVLFEKNILAFPEKSSMIASKISSSEEDILVNIQRKSSIWNDSVIKEMVSHRLIDVVINLDSFVKLILCYLKELKEECYLPFLKISVGEENRHCIIFDKALSTHINAHEERLRYLKYSIIKQYCESYSQKSQSKVRIIKSKDGIKEVSSDNIVKEFASNVLNNFSQRCESPNLTLDHNKMDICGNDFYPSASSKNDVDTESVGANAILNDEPGRYSYGLWKLHDQRVLFRFTNYVQKVEGHLGKQLECVYTRFQIKNESNHTNSEDAWKSLIGSKLNLHSNIIRIIMDAEHKMIDNVIGETFEEFRNKNPTIMNRYARVMGVLGNLLDKIRSSTQFDPDYYLLHLSNGQSSVFKSTNDKNRKDLDLRNLGNFTTF